MKVAFIQETLPSYRIPFFGQLARYPGIDLCVFADSPPTEEGFAASADGERGFHWHRLACRRLGRPGARAVWLSGLLAAVRAERPAVVVTTGNKSFLQNHALRLARRLGRFRLYAFQHAYDYGASGWRRSLGNFAFRAWTVPGSDGVILYTEAEHRHLVAQGLDPGKLWYANNTLDTEAILRVRRSLHHTVVARCVAQFQLTDRPSMLFIGRLVAGRSLERLFEVFPAVKARQPHAQLIVVGDGPLAPALRARYGPQDGVRFTGSLYDAERIACLMAISRLVFHPGPAGLGVVHAFAHAQPYVTYASPHHGPEIAYLVSGTNGLILPTDAPEGGAAAIARFLTDSDYQARLSGAAERTARHLSMAAMVRNVALAIGA